MFVKVTLFAVLFSAVASATTLTVLSCEPSNPTPIPSGQCNTGDSQCCNTVTEAESPSATRLLGLIGAVVQGVDILVGLGCTPIAAGALGGGVNCAQQPVCCQYNQFNGLINVGCTPLSL